jgi:6-phosphogluconolactonase
MEPTRVEVEAVVDAEAAARRAADLIARAGREAVAARGKFAVALSGGRTPWRMLELLASSDLDWGRARAYQVDERVAPPGSDARNLTHLVLALPLELQASLRPMPVDADDLTAAADRYAADLPAPLDLVHLGLGPDGHTASLVPGDPVLEVADRPVGLTAGEYQGHRRMTLTYPAINAARRILFLVTGADKREALARLLAGDRGIPAGRVERQRTLIVADDAALGQAGRSV